jgi:hypothetical protein
VSVAHGPKEEKRMTVKVMTLAVAVTLGALPVVAVYAKPPAHSQAGGLPAVSARVHALEVALGALHTNGLLGAGVMAARINNLLGGPGTSFGAISGTSDSNSVADSVAMVSPPVVVKARDLSVNLTNAPETGASQKVTLLVNGEESTLTCTVSDLQTSCTDTQDAVSVDAGSSLALQVESVGSTPATDAEVTWRAVMP